VKDPRPPTVALKIDVDTRIGTETGIPGLARLFAELDIKATWFLVFGPDNSGKAIRRIFKRKGFVGKMVRTNPVKIYGVKTLLYGTLLPAPMTGLAYRDVLLDLQRQGHEVGLHAWDHVDWQDHVFGWDAETVEREYLKGVEAFTATYGSEPRMSGTPGWQTSATSLAVQDRLGLLYASDTRGRGPFYPRIGDATYKTLQIPGTLPTVDEILGVDGRDEQATLDVLDGMIGPGETHVYTGHSEIEGMFLIGPFARFLRRLKARGARFITLAQLRDELDHVPVCRLDQGMVPGRAGEVAVQGIEIS